MSSLDERGLRYCTIGLVYYNSASQSQSPSEVVNEIRNKCYSILIQSFVSYTSALGSETSEPSGRGYSSRSTEAPWARPPPCHPGMQAGRPHMVTPQASSSGQSRHRTWLGHTPRRHKQEWPHQGSHLSPAQREPLRAVQQPCCPRAVLSRWQPSSRCSLLHWPGPADPDRRRDVRLWTWRCHGAPTHSFPTLWTQADSPNRLPFQSPRPSGVSKCGTKVEDRMRVCAPRVCWDHCSTFTERRE